MCAEYLQGCIPTPDPTNKIRVLIVDADRDYYSQIASRISKSPEFELVGRERMISQAMRIMEYKSVDAVLLETQLPDGEGLLLQRWIGAMFGKTSPKLVFVTRDQTASTIESAMTHGAVGYLDKSSSPEDIYSSIRNALIGPTELK